MATGMRDIADAVNLEPSSLYSHIRSKDEILITICKECADLFTEGMQTIAQKDIPVLEKIRQLLELHIDMAIENPSSITVFNDEWKHLPGPELEQFLDLRKQYEAGFRELIRAGVQEGEMYSFSSSNLFHTLISSVKWLHSYPASKLTPERIADIKRDYFALLDGGLNRH